MEEFVIQLDLMKILVESRGLVLKRLVCLVMAGMALAGLLSCRTVTPEAGSDLQPRAAIIDQLYLLSPNQAFIDKATGLLESYGFSVDVWQGEQVTVDFYREMAGYGYRLIILRAHGGIMLRVNQQGGAAVQEETFLFTGEIYQEGKHPTEQLSDRVQKALMTPDYPLVFAVNPSFIRKELGGSFNDTVVINMGCSSGYIDDLARAFVEKGVSAYLGWSATVTLKYVDEATLILLNKLVADEKMSEAVGQTMTIADRDPYYQSRLVLYPESVANKNLAELLKLERIPRS